MKINLPYHPDDPLTSRLKKNPELWRDCALELCRHHGINVTEFTPYSAGGSLVAAVNPDIVLKIIQPPFIDEFRAEQWALSRMPSTDRLPVKIPKLLAAEVAVESWSYLLMSRVPGRQMDEVWPELSIENKGSLLREIGTLMRFVHKEARLEAGDGAGWNSFLADQAKNCRSRHEKLGMPAWFLEGISFYTHFETQDIRPVLLTGEYTPFNLLVEKVLDSWKLTGMVDFADSFAGHAEYDLIGPGVFLAAGNPKLIQELFAGYGVQLTSELRTRLMTLHLLHRFSHFKRQVAIPEWQNQVSNFEELEKLLWPI